MPDLYPDNRTTKKSTGKRKYHKKSKKGCLPCKKRRVKCDENKPMCHNCERMDIACAYLDDDAEHDHNNDNEQRQDVKRTKISQGQNQNGGNSSIHSNQDENSLTSPFSNILAAAAALPANPANRANGYNNITPGSRHQTEPSQIPPGTASVAAAANIPLAATQRQMAQDPSVSLATSALNLGVGNFNMNIKPEHLKMFAALPPEEAMKLQQQFMSQMSASGLSMSSIFGGIGDLLGTSLPSPALGNPNNSKNNGESNNNDNNIQQNSHAGFSKSHSQSADSNNSSGADSTSDESIQVKSEPRLSPNLVDSPPITASSIAPSLSYTGYSEPLNMLDLRLMYHYTTTVWPTITAAGISEEKIWSEDIPMLAFKYPFLMHSVLAFSATHLSRTERGLDQCVTCHRADALKLLGEAVLEMSPENTDALVASALILIMDSLANASLPTSTSPKSLPPSAWIFHVKGAATILTAVWPLSETSRFYKFISVDLGDLGEIGYDLVSGELAPNSPANKKGQSPSIKSEVSNSSRDNSVLRSKSVDGTDENDDDDQEEKGVRYSSIQCFDDELLDLFPLKYSSPYLPTLAYMNKLYIERNKSDFILRVFAFPALLDKRFLSLLISCDLAAMRIMRCYYKLLRDFTSEMKNKVWFLEGVSKVLPVDVEEYSGGGGMHMMLDFLGGPSTHNDNNFNDIANNAAQSGLLDTSNLPSSVNSGNNPDSEDLISKSLGLSDGDETFMGLNQ